MSFSLYDSNGWVGDLATNKGMGELYAAASGLTNTLLLLETGEADSVSDIVEECADIGALANLKELLAKAEPPVVITDGEGVADESEVSNDISAQMMELARQVRDMTVKIGQPPQRRKEITPVLHRNAQGLIISATAGGKEIEFEYEDGRIAAMVDKASGRRIVIPKPEV